MSRKIEQRRQREGVADIFRSQPTPPSLSTRNSFLPHIQSRGSREFISAEQAETPKATFIPEDAPMIEMRGRIRELELQLLDIRASIERRLIGFGDDFPNRLHKELKIIEERDTHLWKDNAQQLLMLQDAIKIIKNTMQTSFEKMSIEMNGMRRKVDQLELKNSSAEREIEHLSKMPRAIMPPEPQGVPNEVALNIQSLKEALIEERRQRDQSQQDSYKQIQELYQQMRNQEKEMARRFQQYRDDIMEAQKGSRHQATALEQTREEKNRNEAEYIKSVLGNMQKRVDEEASIRTQIEREYRQWTEGKLQFVQEFIRNDERNIADRERNILGMMQEGLTALHEIIGRVKETGTAHVGKVQTMMTENIKDITQIISSIKDGLYSRIEGLEESLQEEAKLRVEQQVAAHNHMQSIAQVIDQKTVSLENQMMSSENRVKSLIFSMQNEADQRDQAWNAWKEEFKANLDSQISSINQRLEDDFNDCNKRYLDGREKSELYLRELKRVQEEFENQLEQVKSQINFEDGVVEQRVKNSMNQMSDQINKELHQLKTDTEKNIANLQLEQSQTLASRLDQMQKNMKSDMFYGILEESKKRKEEILMLDGVLKNKLENSKKEMIEHTKQEIEKVNGKIEENQNEIGNVRNEVENVRNDFGKLSDQLFSEIEDAKEPIKQWTQEYVSEISSNINTETQLAIEVERENINKELEKAKEELRNEIQSVQAASSLAITAESNGIKNTLNEQIASEKLEREKNAKNFMERLENLSHMLQEGVTQSSEAVKALCRALITQEIAERNHSEEGILKSLNVRISGLEDLMKYYTSKVAEELRTETSNFFKNESNERQQMGEKSKKGHKKLKEIMKENRERIEVERCLKDMINSVVEDYTLNTIERQKAVLANLTGNWIKDLHNEFQDNFDNLRESLGNVENESKERIDDLKQQLNIKLAVKDCVENMISVVEVMDMKDGLIDNDNNIQIMFRNLEKMEEALMNAAKETEMFTRKEIEDAKQEIAEKTNKELEAMKQDILATSKEIDDKVEVLFKQSDENTLSLEDLQVHHIINSMLSHLEGSEKQYNSISIKLLLDEVSQLKSLLTAAQNEIQTAIAEQNQKLVDVQTQNVQILEQNTNSEQNLLNNHQHLALAHEAIEETIKEIRNSELGAVKSRLTHIETHLNDKEPERPKSNSLATRVEAFGNEVKELHEAIAKLQADKELKEKATGEIASHINSLHNKITDVQNALKNELARNGQVQEQNQHSVMDQLGRLYQALEDIKAQRS
ncbi:unnamed protein product [Blepharisma stoltei]|uniref:Uncharacterized protein n=1 Tax=Blepharisma stoltei TaxID=1481888 RepID=A0AAU9IIE7_9CILI|nr:unnamed protein product [Blepharisma stoltei]